MWPLAHKCFHHFLEAESLGLYMRYETYFQHYLAQGSQQPDRLNSLTEFRWLGLIF